MLTCLEIKDSEEEEEDEDDWRDELLRRDSFEVDDDDSDDTPLPLLPLVPGGCGRGRGAMLVLNM